jgi:hypothetical protein
MCPMKSTYNPHIEIASPAKKPFHIQVDEHKAVKAVDVVKVNRIAA